MKSLYKEDLLVKPSYARTTRSPRSLKKSIVSLVCTGCVLVHPQSINKRKKHFAIPCDHSHLRFRKRIRPTIPNIAIRSHSIILVSHPCHYAWWVHPKNINRRNKIDATPFIPASP